MAGVEGVRVNSENCEEPSEAANSEPPLKERVYSTWYRLRYGWQFRSSVEIGGSPIWLLGVCYHIEDPSESKKRTGEGVPPHVVAFMEHYHSLTWMTYRTNFAPIPGTPLTTDCGWGCMVRSGQMLLATALQFQLLGRNWRLAGSSSADQALHRMILKWFADMPAEQCPFSLHSLMEQAQLQGHRPGDWFGPSQVATLIRGCVEQAKKEHAELQSLLVYMAHDCTVYTRDVEQLYGDNPEKALLVLVPVRLGSESLNPIYIPCVKSLLALDHCVGIIGGKPKHSVYFVGFQGGPICVMRMLLRRSPKSEVSGGGSHPFLLLPPHCPIFSLLDDKLLHLDPHYCQSVVDMTPRDFDIKSYHCRTPRKLLAGRMDPSCTIGFYCQNLKGFRELQEAVEPLLAPPLQKGVYPFFTFSAQRLDDVLRDSADVQFGTLANGHSDGTDEEDFVVVDCRTTPGTG